MICCLYTPMALGRVILSMCITKDILITPFLDLILKSLVQYIPIEVKVLSRRICDETFEKRLTQPLCPYFNLAKLLRFMKFLAGYFTSLVLSSLFCLLPFECLIVTIL